MVQVQKGALTARARGAGTLLACRTKILWPVVRGEGDGALHIAGRWARNGRAALGHPEWPPGAAATTPGMSGPTGRSAVGACDSGGAYRKRIDERRKRQSGSRGGIGPQRRRRRAWRRAWRRPGRRWRTTHRRRARGAIGTRGPRPPCHHCGSGSGRRDHYNPGIRHGHGHRLTFCHYCRPLQRACCTR